MKYPGKYVIELSYFGKLISSDIPFERPSDHTKIMFVMLSGISFLNLIWHICRVGSAEGTARIGAFNQIKTFCFQLNSTQLRTWEYRNVTLLPPSGQKNFWKFRIFRKFVINFAQEWHELASNYLEWPKIISVSHN